jgi:hypothetical protein
MLVINVTVLINKDFVAESKNPWQVAVKNKRKETIMMTLRQFSAEPSTIPTITSWYLADLSKAQGNKREP